jgi:GT2 family glycosyltransferase
MDLSIIIINYKSTQLVLDCLDSIYTQTDQHSFEIIIVDNDSKDDCKEKALSRYPTIRWVQMDYNAGFARANNAGFAIAEGDYILLLNADTIILDGAIDKSITLLQQQKDAAGCGVQLLHTDGTNQISGAHNIKGGLNALLPLPYLGSLVRYLGYRFKTTIPSIHDFADKTKVDWIVGAYILVKKSVLSKSGLFDEDFFMYMEEIEWCGRLQRQGTLYLFSEPKVIHILGGTSNDYYNTTERDNTKEIWNKKGRQVIVSTALRTRKQLGMGWFLVLVATYIAEIPIFFFGLLIDTILSAGKSSYSWKNFGAYTKSILLSCRYFARMVFSKAYFYKVS